MPDGTPVLRMTDRSIYGFGGYVISRFQLDAVMLKKLFDDSDGERLAARGSMPLLRLPLREGDRYELYHFQNEAPYYDHDGDGIQEPDSTRGSVEDIIRMKVTVPAGTFDALRVEHKEVISWINSSDSSPGRQEITEWTWYVPGIGVVMRETFQHNLWIWSKLRDYKIGGRSTDTTAPYVLSVTPEPASVSAAENGPYISLTLSEMVDPQSRDVIILDTALQSVTGSWSTSGANTWFTPDSPLQPGTYTVTLQSVSDAMGNVLAEPYSWSFTVEQ